jgi:hypothetical protein
LCILLTYCAPMCTQATELRCRRVYCFGLGGGLNKHCPVLPVGARIRGSSDFRSNRMLTTPAHRGNSPGVYGLKITHLVMCDPFRCIDNPSPCHSTKVGLPMLAERMHQWPEIAAVFKAVQRRDPRLPSSRPWTLGDAVGDCRFENSLSSEMQMQNAVMLARNLGYSASQGRAGVADKGLRTLAGCPTGAGADGFTASSAPRITERGGQDALMGIVMGANGTLETLDHRLLSILPILGCHSTARSRSFPL